MKYFITGGTGFIGGRIVRQLLGAGHEVVALVRSPGRAEALKALGAQLAPGDITVAESLRDPMTGVDGVFHVAGWYKVGARDTHRAEPVNVDGTRNVLETMRTLGIAKGVYTSTLAVFSDTRGRTADESYSYDGPHLSEYDRTKWKAHYEVALPMAAAGLPLVIVQPGLVYGPDDPSAIGDLLRQYLAGRMPVLPLETAFSWAHVDDVAQAHILAMEEGARGESYIICGPSHTLADALAIAERATGIPPPRFRLGPGVMRGLSTVMRAVGSVIPLPPTYTAEALRVSAGVTYLGDNTKARHELGYAPRPLEVGLPETLKAFGAGQGRRLHQGGKTVTPKTGP